jgi:hypothetical protein
MKTLQKTALNSRAKLTPQLSVFCQKHNVNHRTWLSVNPKTEKSIEETRLLHLAPSTISGHNVCANSGNCEKICLHFAGIPYLMGGKKTCRVRKTLAFFDNTQAFLELTATAILYNRSLLSADELLAIRLNGTSDIMWETLEFNVSPELSRVWQIKFGIYIVPTVYKSIPHMFSHYPELRIKLYDYTKNRHNWAECNSIGYHLTFSYDGANNKKNIKLCREALENGVNVAAAFDIKKGKELPLYVNAAAIFGKNPEFNGTVLYVQDGDLTDFRPSDTKGGSIIGLRFKLPHGVKWTAADKLAFCFPSAPIGAPSTV